MIIDQNGTFLVLLQIVHSQNKTHFLFILNSVNIFYLLKITKINSKSIHQFFSSNVHYIDREGGEQYMTGTTYPVEMEKKMKLLSYFKRYMTEHLVKAGGNSVRDIGDSVSRIPHLHTWFRTTCAVVMHLTNGSVQVSPQKFATFKA